MPIFNYESKFMQALLHLSDLMILNVLYVLCSIPIFTMGAAQAGLHTAVRVMTDPEDDSSIAKAFFKGFIGGFGKVTLAWCLVGVLTAALIYFGVASIQLGSPALPIYIALFLVCWVQSSIPAIHSWFDCTATQLIRNACLFNLAHPLRSLGAAALVSLPLFVALCFTYFFMWLAPIWLLLYFSVAVLFSELLLKKPLTHLVNRFKESAAEQTQEETAAIEE